MLRVKGEYNTEVYKREVVPFYRFISWAGTLSHQRFVWSVPQLNRHHKDKLCMPTASSFNAPPFYSIIFDGNSFSLVSKILIYFLHCYIKVNFVLPCSFFYYIFFVTQQKPYYIDDSANSWLRFVQHHTQCNEHGCDIYLCVYNTQVHINNIRWNELNNVERRSQVSRS